MSSFLPSRYLRVRRVQTLERSVAQFDLVGRGIAGGYMSQGVIALVFCLLLAP